MFIGYRATDRYSNRTEFSSEKGEETKTKQKKKNDALALVAKKNESVTKKNCGNIECNFLDIFNRKKRKRLKTAKKKGTGRFS